MPPPNYWESGEARRLFAPKELFGEHCDVKQIVLDRIEHLEKVNQEADAWQTVVEDADKDNTMTEHDIFILRLRSLYLAVAIKKYIDRVAIHPAKRWNWEQCIKHSIGALNDIGIEFYSCWRTLQRWHRRLVLSKQNTFAKPRAKTKALPRFFCDNPDAKELLSNLDCQR